MTTVTTTNMMTSEAVIWRKQQKLKLHEQEAAGGGSPEVPPEVPKRTSSRGLKTMASTSSASGRSSASAASIRGQIKSVGNGVANNETASRPPRVCSATGRPLMEWSSESTLGASELVRRHRMLHHHHHYYHHHHHQATYPRRPHPTSTLRSRQVSVPARQAASADEASDSDDIDVCETCSEWLSKALLCSCQVPSSASSSPSQAQIGHEVKQPPRPMVYQRPAQPRSAAR